MTTRFEAGTRAQAERWKERLEAGKLTARIEEIQGARPPGRRGEPPIFYNVVVNAPAKRARLVLFPPRPGKPKGLLETLAELREASGVS